MSFDRSEYWRLSVGGSNNNGKIMFATFSSSVADLYGQTVVSDGSWHMITASYSNGTGAVNFYVDGVADGSATAHSGASLGSGTTRFGIFGANNEDASYNTMESGSRDSMLFQGLIDDARIYNRALSANEVYILHQLGTPTGTSTNATPTNLSIGNSQINENQTVGSIVGLFSATDPDGDNVSYQLTNGAGDSGNSFFSLDTNGTLKTAVVFDYENNASTYSIRARASDILGASVEGNFTITLLDLDDIAPLITLNGDSNITHEAGNLYIDANASWNDAVDGSGVIFASGEINASEPATYVLSYNYTDAAGNVAQPVTRTVNVVDTTAPIISLNVDGNITHEAGNLYIDANASWNDAVDGFGVIVASGEVNASEPGTYVLSYNYTDAAGNVAQTVTRTVHVVDTTAPIISLNGDGNTTHEAGAAYIDANASWNDAVDGFGVIVASGEVNASEPGTYVLSFNYTDAAGNAAQPVTRTVVVVDTTAPIINLHGDANITHEAGTQYIDANASWNDAVDGFGVIVASGEVNASYPGTYVLSYNYTDIAGNVAQPVTRTVHVVDTTAPFISLNGDGNITHEAGAAYIDVNASWSDEVDGFGVIVASGEVNASYPGTYVLSYNYTDVAGNVAQTVIRTVVVVDTTAPLITLHGDSNIIHEAGNPYIDANASWSDAVDGSGVIVASGEINASEPGTYVLSYNYTDAAGNVAQPVTRTVHVVDTTAPIITLHGDSNITHEAGAAYIDANPSWSDAVDGFGVIVASGEVNASEPATYVLSYNYTDAAGNVAQPVTRTVFVVDTTAPIINLHGDANIIHEAGNPYIDANASWSDAVDGSGVIVASGEVNAGVPGLYVLTYNHTDYAGNVAEEVIREVEVINLSPTVLDVMGDGNLSIYENEPNGTIVGVFQGMDPNPGYTLTYSFVGIEETYQSLDHNSTEDNASQLNTPEYLHLDPQGTLTTLRPLDYEVDPVEVPILVRVTDQYGAYYEKLFTVSLLNVVEDLDGDGTEDHYDFDDDGDGYEDSIEQAHGFDPLDRWNYPESPIVRTVRVSEQNQTLIFGVELLSSGGLKRVETGISVFDGSGILITEVISEWNVSKESKLLFTLDNFSVGQKIRYQAFAQNIAGRTTGQFLEYLVGEDTGLGKWWSADLEMDGGWRESTWLGTYLPNSKNDWIYHLQLGWLYVQEEARGGLWLWMPEEDWLWTKESVWPFLWSAESAGWLYPIYSNGNRYFYDYISQGIR